MKTFKALSALLSYPSSDLQQAVPAIRAVLGEGLLPQSAVAALEPLLLSLENKDIYDLPPEELANVPSLPGSLDESLVALENDHEFLLKGDVFTTKMIERWISYKREKEITPLRLRPHPLEFSMYYDI